MSRRHNKPKDEPLKVNIEGQPASAASLIVMAGDAQQRAEPKREVKKAQQCPACYSGLGGIGNRKWQRQVNGPLVKRCYQCDQCGAQWVVDVRTDTEDGIEVVRTSVAKIIEGSVKVGG